MAAELSADQLNQIIANLDTQIATLTGSLGGGQGGAQFVDYKVGALDIKGSQQLEQLLKTRQYYQEQLEKIPGIANDTTTYDVGIDGRDRTDYLGDE